MPSTTNNNNIDNDDKKKKTKQPQIKATKTPSYVRLMMLLCSLSSLFALVKQCVRFQHQKMEFVCAWPDMNALFVDKTIPSTTGTANANANTNANANADNNVKANANVKTTLGEAKAPEAPKFFKPKQLFEYTEDDSIQDKIEGLKEFIIQTSLDSTRLEAAKNPQVQTTLASFLSDSYLFRPTCTAIENLAMSVRSRPYLINTPGLLDGIASYLNAVVSTQMEIDQQHWIAVSKGLDVLARLSGDTTGANAVANLPNMLVVFNMLLTKGNPEIQFKVAGILGNLAIPSESREAVINASGLVTTIVDLLSSSTIDAKASAAICLSNLAIHARGQELIGSVDGSLLSLIAFVRDAEADFIRLSSTAASIEADGNSASASADALAPQAKKALDAMNRGLSAVENLSALENNRILIGSDEGSISLLTNLLLPKSDSQLSLNIVSHAAGTLANLVQTPSFRPLIAKQPHSLSALLTLIAIRPDDDDIKDKAGAVMGNIVLDPSTIPDMLGAIVESLKPSNPERVKLLALNLANSFSELSADHKSLVMNTPGAIEALHALRDGHAAASCGVCATQAQALLIALNAFP